MFYFSKPSILKCFIFFVYKGQLSFVERKCYAVRS